MYLTENIALNNINLFESLRSGIPNSKGEIFAEILIIGDCYISEIPSNVYQFGITVKIVDNQTVFNVNSLKYMDSTYEVHKQVIEKLYYAKIMSFFDQKKWVISEPTNNSFVVKTSENVELYRFFIDIFSYLSGKKFTPMFLHQELYTFDLELTTSTLFHDKVYSLVEEISNFNSNLLEVTKTFNVKASNRFHHQEVKVYIRSFSPYKFYIHFVFDVDDITATLFANRLQRLGFNAFLDNFATTGRDISIFYEPPENHNLSRYINQIIEQVF